MKIVRHNFEILRQCVFVDNNAIFFITNKFTGSHKYNVVVSAFSRSFEHAVQHYGGTLIILKGLQEFLSPSPYAIRGVLFIVVYEISKRHGK